VYTPEISAQPNAPEMPNRAPPAVPVKDDYEEHSDESDVDDDETPVAVEPIQARQFYKTFVARTVSQCLQERSAPQRSIQWLAARSLCITASSFGAAVGNNPYETPKQLAISKVWSNFAGNEFTQYGTFHETDASESLKHVLNNEMLCTLQTMFQTSFGPSSTYERYELVEVGLLKHELQPWMAVSPDGLLFLHGSYHDSAKVVQQGTVCLLVEYKCPARLRHAKEHPYAKHAHNVPQYYMDQMQGIMGLLNKYPDLYRNETNQRKTTWAPNIANALFVVWQPFQLHVTNIPFEELYYTTKLEPALQSWYFTQFLPLAILKHNGVLEYNSNISSTILEC